MTDLLSEGTGWNFAAQQFIWGVPAGKIPSAITGDVVGL